MKPVPVYRLRNNVEHFYTISPDERDGAVSQYGYTYEGIAFYASTTDVEDTTTLRDTIAASICGHIVTARSHAYGHWSEPTEAARLAYEYADALLAARAR